MTSKKTLELFLTPKDEPKIEAFLFRNGIPYKNVSCHFESYILNKAAECIDRKKDEYHISEDEANSVKEMFQEEERDFCAQVVSQYKKYIKDLEEFIEAYVEETIEEVRGEII